MPDVNSGVTASHRPELIVSGARGGDHEINSSMVETTQIAPTILKLLGLNPNSLQAVLIEHTRALPLGD